MTGFDPEVIFKRIILATQTSLTRFGYKRQGKNFRMTKDGNCGIIQFQRSTASTRDRIVFTINLGVVCGALLDMPANLSKAGIVDAHVRERIGILLQDHHDKWWEISADTNADALELEIVGHIIELAVPYVEASIRTDQIIALWESGKSPGLTEHTRTELLAELKANRAVIRK